MKQKQMRITLDFAQDQEIQDELRKQIMEALTGLAKSEISSSLDEIIASKLREGSLDGKIQAGMDKYIQGIINRYLSPYDTYNAAATSIYKLINDSINDYLTRPKMQTMIEGMINKALSENFNKLLETAINIQLTTNKIKLKIV